MRLHCIANANASASTSTNLALVGICSKNCFFFATTDPHYNLKKKVNCIFLQALRLCTGCTAHWGGGVRGIALLFLDCGTRRGWGVSVMTWPLFTTGKDPVPIIQEAGWAPGLVWTGAENITPTGIWSPDRPAHSQLLYWLRYPAHSL